MNEYILTGQDSTRYWTVEVHNKKTGEVRKGRFSREDIMHEWIKKEQEKEAALEAFRGKKDA